MPDPTPGRQLLRFLYDPLLSRGKDDAEYNHMLKNRARADDPMMSAKFQVSSCVSSVAKPFVHNC